jgi:hypothetical protein
LLGRHSLSNGARGIFFMYAVGFAVGERLRSIPNQGLRTSFQACPVYQLSELGRLACSATAPYE